MPQFHETGMGKRFFDAQLPNLIRQIARVADALEEANRLKQPDAQENIKIKLEDK